MNSQQIPPEIRQFLEQLLKESEMLTLDDQMKEGMIEELFYQLENYLVTVIVDHLQPDDLEKFIAMNQEKKSKEEIEQFVNEKVPNAQEIFTNAFLEFKKMYLEDITTAKSKQVATQ